MKRNGKTDPKEQKSVLLFSHLSEAIAAVDRSVGLGLKGNPSFAAASGANGRKILAGAAGSVFAGIAAGFAALGLILETALCVKLLFTDGKYKFLTALFAHQCLVFHDRSSL